MYRKGQDRGDEHDRARRALHAEGSRKVGRAHRVLHDLHADREIVERWCGPVLRDTGISSRIWRASILPTQTPKKFMPEPWLSFLRELDSAVETPIFSLTLWCPMEYKRIVQTVVETPTYLAIAKRLFSEEERADIVALVAADPECGDAIGGTGGFRKVRVARKGMGKSGGARVVYIWRNERFRFF